MQRRAEFSFQGSPARGLLPPRPPPAVANPNLNPMAPRYVDEEDRWLQASLQASPDYYSSGGSGTPSPQLWAQQARPRHHPELLHRQYPASAGSSPSRAQAIAGYRREMLDLVRGLPESAYELSLRDIVEHHQPSPSPSPPSPPSAATSLPSPPPAPAPSSTRGPHASRAVPVPVPVPAAQEKKDEPAVAAAATDAEDGGGGGGKQGGSWGKKQGRKQRTTMRRQRSRGMERSVSLDTGLLIKLFLPLSVGGKKKVSPKPDAAKDDKKKKNRKEEKKQGKKKEAAVPAPAQEEVWWTNSEFSEAGSSGRTSSTGSSSNSNSSAAGIRNVNGGAGANPRAPARSWSRKRTGCYAFFRPNKGKNGVNQD